MKNLKQVSVSVIILLMTFLSTNNSFAKEKINDDEKTVKIEYTIGNKTVILEKTFPNEAEANQFAKNELEKITITFSNADPDVECTVTVSVGSGRNYISVTVKGDCKKVYEMAKKLKAKLTALL